MMVLGALIEDCSDVDFRNEVTNEARVTWGCDAFRATQRWRP